MSKLVLSQDPGLARPGELSRAERPREPGSTCVVAALVDVDDFVIGTRLHGDDWADRQLAIVNAGVEQLTQGYESADSRHIPPDAWVITFVGRDGEAVYARMLAAVSRLRHEVTQLSDVTTTVGICRPRHGPQALVHAVEQAQAITMTKLVCGGDRVIDEDEFPAPAITPPPMDRELMSRVRAGDRRGAARLVAAWIEDCAAQPGVSAAQLKEWIIGQMLLVMDEVSPRRTSSGSTNWLGPVPLALGDLMKVSEIHERSYLRLWVTDALEQLVPAPKTPTPPGLALLERAERYMTEHFADPVLRLDKLAHEVSVSPYYLSHLFQRERQSTFLRELTGLRLRAAKRMLATGDSTIEQIARRTGHTNTKRFRLVFKRQVGCTPSEYRRTHTRSDS